MGLATMILSGKRMSEVLLNAVENIRQDSAILRRLIGPEKGTMNGMGLTLSRF